ncbi:MAG: bifunctional tRNA pseudouridine(32) synthase/23S rRNA pseudouridine(746) synthase RluA [Rhodoferax sp.]
MPPEAGLWVQVLHADAQVVVLIKPSGLLSAPGRGPDKQDCAARQIQAIFPDAQVVHRLDMATSGLMLMARGTEMQRRLSVAFAQRHIHKRYEAVVAGHPMPNNCDEDGWSTVDWPIAADWPNRPRRIIDWVHGKPSLTRWRVLARERTVQGQEKTRLALEPITGRSHQLRVHLMALGHPILGDALYAEPALASAAPRLLLHACALEVPAMGECSGGCWHSPAPF